MQLIGVTLLDIGRKLIFTYAENLITWLRIFDVVKGFKKYYQFMDDDQGKEINEKFGLLYLFWI